MKRRDLVSSFVALCGFPVFVMADDHENEPAGYVSLIRLIANPSSFDGRRVRLQGYVENNGVDRAVGLYLSESDSRNHIAANSIDLRGRSSASLREFMGKLVILNATFHAPRGTLVEFRNGHLDQISGMVLVTNE